MNNSDMVSYKRNDMLNILKEINLLVVSMNDIGMASIDNPKIVLSEELLKFFQENDTLERLSDARMVLSEPFEDESDDEGVGLLEKAMSNLNYWKHQ